MATRGTRKQLQRLLLSLGLVLVGVAAAWSAFDAGNRGRLPAGWEPAGARIEETMAELAKAEAEVTPAEETQAEEKPPAEPPSDPAASPVEPLSAYPAEGEDSAAGGFDLNRATEAEWDALPGIGPAKARAIVEERERNGPFYGIDDLERVKGIGPKLVERLREAIEAQP